MFVLCYVVLVLISCYQVSLVILFYPVYLSRFWTLLCLVPCVFWITWFNSEKCQIEANLKIIKKNYLIRIKTLQYKKILYLC